MNHVLQTFSPPVRDWFRAALGEPTPPQVEGWPAIQRGEHTLILAPTGSGKTLAAFLWGIDLLFRELSQNDPAPDSTDPVSPATCHLPPATRPTPGIRLVYISPLKALNNDVQRNLRTPLAGIKHRAHELGLDFPDISVLVRSGDTPQRERQAMVSRPPHILITTPESLYLMLTSPRARDIFRTVRTAIVDEIHTLAGNKRGVHLALSLERLQHLAGQPVQRIGLSATIRPLAEVARFLGGNEWVGVDKERGRQVDKETSRQGDEGAEEGRVLRPRAVTMVDAGYRKALDLRVETVVEDFRSLPGESIWPSIMPRVAALIRQHRTTLIFANDRRRAERTADRLNEQIAAEAAGRDSGLIEQGVARGLGMMAAGTGAHAGPIRAHHGSMSKEARLEMEQQLKAGQLPALVGTSSLELGIDIGAVDLVVQLQSPKSVAQGLQRVGRSGHLVGQTSKGRIFPTHREDVMEAAAIAGGMLRGDVEPVATPRQPLDVLAQQIVAAVAVEDWEVDALYDLLRSAYAYQELTPRVYRAVLEMLAGAVVSSQSGRGHSDLKARLSWDRVNHRLAALPGTRLTALTNGGTIANRGAFGAYLGNSKTKLGELDEEFVYETRIGDTFMLGSQVWRVIEITDDKVQVVEAPGSVPRMPFWRGDYPWRPFELGKRVGEFRRAVAERLLAVREMMGEEGKEGNEGKEGKQGEEGTEPEDGWGLSQWLEQARRAVQYEHAAVPSGLRITNYALRALTDLLDWLHRDYALDDNSAWQVLAYAASQLDSAGAISSDRAIVVELFDDALGDPRLVVHSPFGGRVNGALGLALASALRERTGVEPEVQSNDDGILLRYAAGEADFPTDVVAGMTPQEARERLLHELPNAAVFGAHFRQNAARALLLPSLGKGKRTPFWLQRLRAKDLLQAVRQVPDFPIVAETYREVLQDVLDLPHLEQVLAGIQAGDIEVVAVESLRPSPVAQSLLWSFASIYMYEWDTPKAERQLQTLAAQADLLQDLLKDVALDQLLRPEAVAEVRSRLQHTAPTTLVRSAEELAVLLQQMGDLSSGEIAQRAAVDPSPWISQLAGQRRIALLAIPTAHGPADRWVAAEYVHEYAAAFATPTASHPTNLPAHQSTNLPASLSILTRCLRHAGPVTVDAIRQRYAFPADWLQAELDRLVGAGDLAHGRFTPDDSGLRITHYALAQTPTVAPEYVDRQTLEQIHRRTLSILRQEVQPVPLAAYADFLARWQHMHPAGRLEGPGALTQVVQQLRALPVAGQVWERDVLPLRLAHYDPAELSALCQDGELVWVGSGDSDPRRARVRFLFRGEGSAFLAPAPQDLAALSEPARQVYAFLRSEGAVFFADICGALELAEDAAEAALIELALAGLATNDSLDTLRQIVLRGGAAATSVRQPLSALETDLAERLGPRPLRVGPGRRPAQSELRAARRRVRQRLEAAPPSRWSGRWAAVHRFGVLGKPLPADEIASRQARQLLARYGVVTRDSLAGEEGAWDWGRIYATLQRLEMRGEVRRGYFVQGLPGVQFALPEVVERLRALRSDDDETLVVLNACDPANLYGPAQEGGPLAATGEPLAFARIPSTWLVQQRGLPVLLAEDTASRITTAQGADDTVVQAALQALVQHLATFERRLMVHTWNGDPVLESPGQPLLEVVGFYREYPGMAWERSMSAIATHR
jgi:ATP-dependent helicase Lhr and Lhr-like helicase